MKSLTLKKSTEVSQFDPAKARTNDAKADAMITYAKEVRDWPLLEKAVEKKIDDQVQFVAWWDGNITRRGEIGRGRPLDAHDLGHLTQERAEEETKISNQQVSKWKKRLEDIEAYAEMLFGFEYRKAMALKGQTDQKGASGTGENEWFTPPEYILLARSVMGEIDLDPATSDVAQRVVKAKQFFTKKQDGLKQEWHGRVWLNPPYAQPHIAQFVSKMVEEFSAGRVSEGIMLTHNYTDTAWFHEGAAACSAICFTRGRIKFVDEKGKIAAPTQGQAFFYFGERDSAFSYNFKEVGFIKK